MLYILTRVKYNSILLIAMTRKTMDCNCKKYQKSLTHVSNELKNIKRFMTISWLPGILSQFNNEDLILLISHVEQLEIQLESLDNLVTAINHSIKITNH